MRSGPAGVSALVRPTFIVEKERCLTPITFAQPAPADSFTQIARSRQAADARESLAVAANFSGQLQERYARDADRMSRSQLGFAQLESDAMLKARALGIQETEVAQRGDLAMRSIEARAQLEMDQWITQQRFTLQDRQELTRQENALGELVSKRDSGEISEQEFFRMANRVAPRVNSLQAKDQHNKVKAQSMALEEMAMQRKAAKENQEFLTALNSGELDSRIDHHIPAEHAQFMSDFMKKLHPELQPGSPQYDATIKMEAAKFGKTIPMVKGPKGELTPLSKMLGTDKANSHKGELGAEDVAKQSQEATKAALDWAKKEAEMGRTPSGEQIAQKAVEIANIQRQVSDALGGSPQSRKKKIEEVHVADLQKMDKQIELYSNDPNVPPGARREIVDIYTQMKDLAYTYPPSEPRPDSVTRKLKELDARAVALKANIDTVIQTAKAELEARVRKSTSNLMPRFNVVEEGPTFDWNVFGLNPEKVK